MTTLTCTAPGKVLILGGYAVLERPNPGLVLAVDARFHCKVSQVPTLSTATARLALVKLSSPQWGENGWEGSFEFDSTPLGGLLPLPTTSSNNTERNPYIEKTVSWTLQVLAKQGKYVPSTDSVLQVEMAGDNDFYSQLANLALHKQKRTKLGLAELPKQTTVRNKSAKTGLGSSAAMISAIVCALVHFFDKTENGRQIEFAHRLAQMCHAAVQGKIGSGFDVCAAFFGSMQYVRYDAAPTPSACLELMNDGNAQSIDALEACCRLDTGKDSCIWNQVIESFHLPPQIQLLCAEVEDSGSETPSMSKKIMDWKRANPSDAIWRDLIARNLGASNALKALLELSNANEKSYTEELQALSQLPSNQWPPSSKFAQCAQAFLLVRESLRLLGTAAGVPVEPESQQKLCDATLLNVPGTLVCGVPGAGGNDAIYALVLGEEAAKRAEAFWEQYSDCLVCPLLLRESKGGQGVKMEWK